MHATIPSAAAGRIEKDMVAARASLAACNGSHASCEACDVRSHAVCAVVGRERLPRLAAIACWRRVAAGQMLFHEDDAAEEVFTLTQGTLKLYKLLRVRAWLLSGGTVSRDDFKLLTYLGETHEEMALLRQKVPALLGHA